MPLILLFAAFVVTFLVTRGITRLIRSGKGPFKDNVTDSGVHVHHAVPGLILLLVGSVVTTGAATPAIRCLGGIAVGVGASLVLDEFALILHLEDVYWANEGRASVQTVALATVCLALAVLGFAPVTGADFEGGPVVVIVAVVVLAVFLWLSWICAMKGKYRVVLFGIFLPVVTVAGAIRLARPGSPWFVKRYAGGSRKQRVAIERAARSDQIWGRRWLRFADAIAGAPTQPVEVSPPAGDVRER
ncbi:hypothetical protein HJ588_06370 [Flexivirga sp. ID2601S]|uniref:Integral membrane protein n=1 Tax=Flexivirga aerilata TaxID=1656889 RepID=A0A849AI54_9MICO|nr:hypothetical protein [Flexivirga aerilata]